MTDTPTRHSPERDPRKQMVTAVTLLEMFNAQIAEFEGMNRAQRRTPRGRDLESRIGGLREGQRTWDERAAALREQIAAEDAAGVGEE
jgi:hypothetical protein